MRVPFRLPLAVAALAIGAACSERGGDEENASTAEGGQSGSSGSSGSASSDDAASSGSVGTMAGDAGATCSQSPPFSMVGLTQYEQAGVGNCDLPWPADNMYAAASSSEYDMGPLGPSGACGRCVELTGPTGLTATLAVVDQCPTAGNPKCTNGHLDLSPQAYAAVVPGNYPTGGEVVNGASSASWRYVACTVAGPIVYHFKDGTNPYWIAIQIRNSRFGIKAIRYLAASGSWQDAQPRTDPLPYFVVTGWGSNAISLQAVDELGRALEDDDVKFAANADVAGHAQFPPCAP